MYAAEKTLSCNGRFVRNPVSWLCFDFLVWREEDTHLDDAETCKPPNIDAETAHVVVLHPFKDRLSGPHA